MSTPKVSTDHHEVETTVMRRGGYRVECFTCGWFYDTTDITKAQSRRTGHARLKIHHREGARTMHTHADAQAAS